MYDITRTRMLLTTAVFAAVAALSAGGASARVPADTSSASAVQESLRTGRYAAQPPSWRGKGGKGEETAGVTNTLRQTRRSWTWASRRLDSAVLGAGVEGVVLTTPCRGGVALP